MLRFTEVIGAGAAESTGPATVVVNLSFEDRRRSRLLVRLGDGREAALMLPRGTALRDGDRLRGAESDLRSAAGGDAGGGRGAGEIIVEVRAARETLSVARTADPRLLTRAAYHLGNRHIPLQVGSGWVAYQHDHVLDDLVRGLGLALTTELLPFEPESGGYPHGHDRTHGHAHDHAHDHVHDHDHDRDRDA